MSENYVSEELAKAGAALDDARTMADAGVSDEAIVNRLYYACFHAANAVLYDRDFEPSTHKGTISLFGQELVVDGPISRERGRFLNQLRDYREQADYGHDPVNADVESLLARADEFVADLTELAT